MNKAASAFETDSSSEFPMPVGARAYGKAVGVGPLTGPLETQFPGAGTVGTVTSIVMHALAAGPAIYFIGRN